MVNEGNSKKKAAIVLGGGLEKVEVRGQTAYEPKEQVKRRLDKAYEFLDAGEVAYIITTGKYSKRVGIDFNVAGPKTEAEVGKKYLEEKFGIGEDRILYENQSFDTIGNAWFAKKTCLEPFNITSCTIITSDYHIERSEIVFRWVLGPKYAVEFVPVESKLSDVERERRNRLERIFINYAKAYLLSSIPPGDDGEIGKFMENEHLRYCLSERSEAMLSTLMETAAIESGY